MNIRPRRRRSTSVDITPLIDVVFLLLIFFMVSTTFERETQILLELPEASGQEAEQKPDDLEITVDRQGIFYVNKREVINTEGSQEVRLWPNELADSTLPRKTSRES